MSETTQSPPDDRDADGQEDRAPESPQSPRRRAIGWRVLRWVGGTLLILLLVLVGLLYFFLGTQAGLRTAIDLAERFAPGVIKVGVAEGRVLGHLHLEDFKLHLPATDVDVGRFDLLWSPARLFSGVLKVDRLAASDIDVTLGPSPAKKEPLTLPNIALPLRVDLAEASVDRLSVQAQGAQAPMLALEHAALSADLDGSELRIASLEALLEKPPLAANAKGHARLRGDYPLALTLDWQVNLPPDATLEGDGKVDGDLKHLIVEHRLRGSVEADLQAQVDDVLHQPSWKGSLEVAKVDVPAFDPGAPAVETSAQLETHGDLSQASLVGSLDARAPNLPDFGHLAADLDLLWKDKRLTINKLDMTEQVSDASLDATGEVDLNPQPGRFHIQGDWKRLRWPLTGDLLAQSSEGQLNASGSFEDFTYSLDTRASGPSFPAATLSVKGKGTSKSTELETLRAETLDGVLDGGGTLTWAPELQWDFHLLGRDLNPGRFARGLDGRVTLNLETQGDLKQYTYDLVTNSRGNAGMPPASLTLVGTGDLEKTEIKTLRLDALDGRIQGQATVDLAPTLGWDAALDISGIDPGSYAPEWPGKIDGRITSQGTLPSSGPQLTAVIEQLKGRLRGYPIAASGKVAMEGQTLTLDGVSAESGPSKLSVDGRVGETLDLDFTLKSPDLASLAPQAKGRLDVGGQVEGTLKAPSVVLDLSAQQLAYAGNGIDRLTGKANVDLAGDGRFKVQLDGQDLTAAGQTWSRLAVRGDGSLPSNQVSMSLTGEPLTAEVALSGGVTTTGGYGYKGQLRKLSLSAPKAGQWSLQRPAPIEVEPPKISAGPLCLRQAQGSGGCLDFAQAKAGQWTAGVDLSKLDFALLKPFLPKDVAADGLARVKGRFTAQGPTLTGKATAEIPKGLVTLDLGAGQRQKLDLSSTTLTVDANSGGLNARLDLPLKDLGGAKGSLSLPGWRLDAPARPGQALRGSLKAKLDNFSPIAKLVPQVTDLTGAVDADVTLGGTLGQPGFKGLAEVKGVGFLVPLVGLEAKDLAVTATAPTMDRVSIQGGGLIGGKRLDITGNGGLGPQGFSAQMKIDGKKLKVADTKEYFVRLSPNIDIQAGPSGASVRGEIRVPEARIRPHSVPSGTVSPSPDVTFSKRQAAPPYPLSIDVKLVLGKEVTIDAFGVRGRLGGSLAVIQQPGKEMVGDGQLQITDGQYQLSGSFGITAELGAPLTITQGRLIYAKTPLGNPGLLLEAERQAGDITAGVRVLGTLRNPKLAFFSDSNPDMTQSEITKYLLTGIPPSGNDQTSNAGLAVGTYVAPKIYMEYESGLGDEPNKVKLRYDVSRHIEIQTETGNSQGADIYFKFEN